MFDYFVVVQFTNKLVWFYEKPLIMGGLMAPYTLKSNVTEFNATTQTSLLVDKTMKSWDISISPDNDTSVFFFGVGGSDGKLERYHF